MDRKCFREGTPTCPNLHEGVPSHNLQSGQQHLDQTLVAVCSFLCFCPPFRCYRDSPGSRAPVMLLASNLIYCVTLSKALSLSGE